jgi:catechol 2,3-dioxygenase
MAALPYGIQPATHRLPDTTRIGRVQLQVTDLARSLAFYTDVLGLRVIALRDGGADLGAHDDDRVFLELRAGATKTVPRRGRLGLFHFAILLPSRAALGRFLVHLSDRGVHAGASDHLVSEAIYLSDPDGLGIEVYADRPRDTWRHEGRELSMSTLPLDAKAVAEAGGNVAWSGMPAGTTMGHVHLHVGSLEEARAFYHDALGLDLVVWSALLLGGRLPSSPWYQHVGGGATGCGRGRGAVDCVGTPASRRSRGAGGARQRRGTRRCDRRRSRRLRGGGCVGERCTGEVCPGQVMAEGRWQKADVPRHWLESC